MARPSKTASNAEGHRTKAEIECREAAEKAALTGITLRESDVVAVNAIAHAEFERVQGLLIAIGKNDALYESVINDYCEYKADIARYITMRDSIERRIEDIDDADIDSSERYKLITQMYKQVMDCDKQIQAFQKKRFDIEKENGMTIASSLRSIPKAPPTKKNPLMEALSGDS